MNAPDDFVVTVCDQCLRASCWDYEFCCENFKSAGITTRTVAELKVINRENHCFWDRQFNNLQLHEE